MESKFTTEMMIIARYGTEAQIDMFIEESSELTKALLKMRRNSDNLDKVGALRDDIIDEIADVTIMLEQLQIIYDCKPEVIQERVNFKLARQLERMKAEAEP